MDRDGEPFMIQKEEWNWEVWKHFKRTVFLHLIYCRWWHKRIQVSWIHSCRRRAGDRGWWCIAKVLHLVTPVWSQLIVEGLQYRFMSGYDISTSLDRLSRSSIEYSCPWSKELLKNEMEKWSSQQQLEEDSFYHCMVYGVTSRGMPRRRSCNCLSSGYDHCWPMSESCCRPTQCSDSSNNAPEWQNLYKGKLLLWCMSRVTIPKTSTSGSLRGKTRMMMVLFL